MGQCAKELRRSEKSESRSVESLSLRFGTKLTAIHMLKDLQWHSWNCSDIWKNSKHFGPIFVRNRIRPSRFEPVLSAHPDQGDRLTPRRVGYEPQGQEPGNDHQIIRQIPLAWSETLPYTSPRNSRRTCSPNIFAGHSNSRKHSNKLHRFFARTTYIHLKNKTMNFKNKRYY